MLVNVEQVLAGQGAGFQDIVSATTYLKRPDYLEAFRRIGRPEWLCETEVTAILA